MKKLGERGDEDGEFVIVEMTGAEYKIVEELIYGWVQTWLGELDVFAKRLKETLSDNAE